MTKVQKNLMVFLIILFQTLGAISVGLMALYFTTLDNVPPDVYVGGANVGNLTRAQAQQKLESFYGGNLKGQRVTINIEGGDKKFELDLDQVGGRVDYNATLDRIWDKKDKRSFLKVITSYFTSSKKNFSPAITFDEARLSERFKDLAGAVRVEPVDANIYLKENKVIKLSGKNGQRLNVENAVSKLKSELASGYKTAVVFSPSNGFEIEAVEPEITSKDLEGADEIIGTYSTEIKSAENLDSIKKAVNAINRVLLLPEEAGPGKTAGEFSFNYYLGKADALKEQNDEGYNQVASTLHAAVLFAGIDASGITRVRHKSAVEYIEPGLDVKVFGNVEDFKFRNSLEHTVVIFSEIKDNKVAVSLVGTKKNKDVSNDISIDVVKKTEPAVVPVENEDLKPGEKLMVSPGVNGVKVNVYKVELRNNGETDKRLLYSDEYDPVEAIMQIGPSTLWNSPSMK